MRHYPEPFEGKPDTETTVDIQKIANKGEIVYDEQHPADPLKDELAKVFSHRGGLASARNEHY